MDGCPLSDLAGCGVGATLSSFLTQSDCASAFLLDPVSPSPALRAVLLLSGQHCVDLRKVRLGGGRFRAGTQVV